MCPRWRRYFDQFAGYLSRYQVEARKRKSGLKGGYMKAMKRHFAVYRRGSWVTAATLLCAVLASAAPPQDQGSSLPAAASETVVPHLVSFSGTLRDPKGTAVTGSVTMTFSLYTFQEGGNPLWTETQKVRLDDQGHYAVLLGATAPSGLPLDLFTSGQAQWLGVQPALAGVGEQPRVLLVGMPYALKAADADTLGGLPASAFAMAATGSSGTSPSATATAQIQDSNAAGPVDPLASTIAGTGTANTLAMFTGSSTVGNSLITQSGGAAVVSEALQLPPLGTATSSRGFDSQPQDSLASAYNSSTRAAVEQHFRWWAEPVSNNTSSPSGKLNLLFASGTGTPAETGLSIAHDGKITFASGQTFPGTGSGTVTSVGSGAGLTGGPITSSGSLSIAPGGVTNTMLQYSSITVNPGTDITGGGAVSLGGSVSLSLDTTKVPQLNAANTFMGNQSVTGNFSTTGTLSAGSGSFGGNVSSANLIASGSVSGSSASFSGTTGTQTLQATNAGSGASVLGSSTDTSYGVGVEGTANSSNGVGVWGIGANRGVEGDTSGSGGIGVIGFALSSTGLNYAVYGDVPNGAGYGVFGVAGATSGYAVGVSGTTNSPGGYGVLADGAADNTNYGDAGLALAAYGGYEGGSAAWGGDGVHAYGGGGGGTPGDGGTGVWAIAGSGSNSGYGGWGIYAEGGSSNPGQGGDGIYAVAGTGSVVGGNGQAGYFAGDIEVTGAITAGTKDFKIDHPLDPANKYLYHASVESSEMLNIYTGTVTLDSGGAATVRLPDWFESLNTDFRYQLTCIGAFAPVYVAQKLRNNGFRIAGGQPGMEVSWQITAVRHDAFATAHPLVAEVDKSANERGYYIHPELYGQPDDKQIEWGRRPQLMKHREEVRQKATRQAAPNKQVSVTH
jgi:trimeric autotransporter adhesin